jgi:hypothetical protein
MRSKSLQTPVTARRRNGSPRRASPAWKTHLSAYPILIEIRFAKKQENRHALDLLDSEELLEMPYGLTDGGIIVPVEGVPYFTQAGKFTEKKIHRANAS